MKKLRLYIFLFSILTFLSVIFLVFFIKKNEQKLNCATPEPNLICGTISFTENETKGKEIFDSNCSACHRLHKNMTGPALKNVDSIKLKTWLTFKNQIDTTKVKTFKKEYHIVTFSNYLDKEDVESLYDYLKQ